MKQTSFIQCLPFCSQEQMYFIRAFARSSTEIDNNGLTDRCGFRLHNMLIFIAAKLSQKYWEILFDCL